MMKISLNGEDYTAKEPVSVEGLLKELGVHPQRVAVEVNFRIIRKADYSRAMIKDGDSVEVVSFVGGGI
ncbi:sulfur carrier protein ThiS [bacterium BMS3Bbin06]|nr:sulfur carrier protein ThiS [bacterium BMS3Abin08]GBE34148.1 sulfur carrier protein ThiS [bacterium BMS3Bbin06]